MLPENYTMVIKNYCKIVTLAGLEPKPFYQKSGALVTRPRRRYEMDKLFISHVSEQLAPHGSLWL